MSTTSNSLETVMALMKRDIEELSNNYDALIIRLEAVVDRNVEKEKEAIAINTAVGGTLNQLKEKLDAIIDSNKLDLEELRDDVEALALQHNSLMELISSLQGLGTELDTVKQTVNTMSQGLINQSHSAELKESKRTSSCREARIIVKQLEESASKTEQKLDELFKYKYAVYGIYVLLTIIAVLAAIYKNLS